MAETTAEQGWDDRLQIAIVAAGLAIGAYAVGNVFALALTWLLEGVGVPVLGRPRRTLLVSTIGLQGLGFGGLAVVYLHQTGRGIGYVRARLPSLLDLGWIVVGFPVLFGVQLALFNGLASAGIPVGNSRVLDAVRAAPTVALVLAVLSILLVGPAEELLYRGLVQQTFDEAIGPVGAIVATSAVFAVIHYPAVSGSVEARLAVVAITFASALVLGTLYEWSGNLVVPAVVHGLFNASQFLLIYLGAGGTGIGG